MAEENRTGLTIELQGRNLTIRNNFNGVDVHVEIKNPDGGTFCTPTLEGHAQRTFTLPYSGRWKVAANNAEFPVYVA